MNGEALTKVIMWVNNNQISNLCQTNTHLSKNSDTILIILCHAEQVQ